MSACVWVVEDDNVVAQLVMDLLRVSGYNVSRFSSGQSAIDALSSSSGPDLVILDLMMPLPDGNDVLDLIARLGRPPVLLLTGYAGHLRQDLKSIPAGIIEKPFRFEELKRTVAEAIKEGKAQTKTEIT